MYSDFAVNKYLHTVASGWIFINIMPTCTFNFISNIYTFFRNTFTCKTAKAIHKLRIHKVNEEYENFSRIWMHFVGHLIKALRYKPEYRGFEFRCHLSLI